MKVKHFIRFMNVLLAVVLHSGFHIGNVHSVKSVPVDCDFSPYMVPNYNQGYCFLCKICSNHSDSSLHYDECKKKIPSIIPGQGFAWCTGKDDTAIRCQPLNVLSGELNCTSNIDVYSECTLVCKVGYIPGKKNWEKFQCQDNLQWSISEKDISCNRTVKPDKPSIISYGPRQEVKPGNEKTLKCEALTDFVGKLRTYWYFKDRLLPSNAESSIYVVHANNKESEGEYFCQVEDQNGKSDFSAGYFLKVENEHGTLESKWYPVIAVLVVIGVLALLFLLWLILRKRKFRDSCHEKIINIWHTRTAGQDEQIDSCLSSHDSSVGGYSKTCETSSSLINVDTSKLSMSKTENTECKFLLLTEVGNAEDVNCGIPSDLEENNDAITFHVPKQTENYDSVVHRCDADDHANLRDVLRNCSIMRQLITLLDQKPSREGNKPTFHMLGRFLGECTDKIKHHEFKCEQCGTSPTEAYIMQMSEQGQGLSRLVEFLKKYKHTYTFAERLESYYKKGEGVS